MRGKVSDGIFALVVASCLVGCSATNAIELDDERPYLELNYKGSQLKAKVLLYTGDGFGAEALRVDADSTSFIVVEEYTVFQGDWSRPRLPATPYTKNVATSEIGEVRFNNRNHGAGAIRGALIGLGVGFVIGGAMFAAQRPCERGFADLGNPSCRTEDETLGGAIALGGLSGAAWGAIFGVAFGRSDTNVYRMPSTHRERAPNAPVDPLSH